MPFGLALNDKVEITAFCRANDQYAANVFHYNVSAVAGIGGSDLQGLNQIVTTWPAQYKTLLAAEASYFGTRFQIIKPTRRVAQFSVTNAGVGSVVGGLLSTQTTGLIGTRTDLTGKSFRGRSYIPFPSEGDNNVLGDPAVNYLLNLGLLKDLLYSDQVLTFGGGNSVTLSPVLYSRSLNTFTPITQTLISSLWATQRRRAHREASDSPPT